MKKCATKKYAVSFIDFYNNDLSTKIVFADSWLEAFKEAHPDYNEWVTSIGPVSQEEAKQAAFDADFTFNVVET